MYIARSKIALNVRYNRAMSKVAHPSFIVVLLRPPDLSTSLQSSAQSRKCNLEIIVDGAGRCTKIEGFDTIKVEAEKIFENEERDLYTALLAIIGNVL